MSAQDRVKQEKMTRIFLSAIKRCLDRLTGDTTLRFLLAQGGLKTSFHCSVTIANCTKPAAQVKEINCDFFSSYFLKSSTCYSC